MSRIRVAWHYLKARRRQFADRAALETWQQNRLQQVVRKAPSRYRFYAELQPAALDDLPILDKATMVARFADLNRVGLKLEDALTVARAAETQRDFSTTLRGVSVGLSSGTTGRQSAFLTTASERDRWAGQVLARVFPGGIPSQTRVVLVLRAGGPLYGSVQGGQVSFRFVDLALPAERILEEIVEANPTVLVAPPSVLALAARSGVKIAPHRILSVAEVLDPHDADLISGVFGVRVDQVYQATEGFLGMSCSQGTLHLAEDVVHIERIPVGPDRFIPVVTDLWRTTQAMLRVRLDDVLVVGSGCTCGSPMLPIAEVVGRADDVLWLPSSDGLRPFFADFVRGAVLGAGVDDFRVQQSASRWGLATKPASAWANAATALAEAVRRSGCVVPDIVEMSWPVADPQRKLRRVRRDPDVEIGDLRSQ